MKHHNTFIVLGLCLVCIFVAGILGADEITMSGSVYPIAWDDSDNLFAAAIATSQGEEYKVQRHTRIGCKRSDHGKPGIMPQQ